MFVCIVDKSVAVAVVDEDTEGSTAEASTVAPVVVARLKSVLLLLLLLLLPRLPPSLLLTRRAFAVAATAVDDVATILFNVVDVDVDRHAVRELPGEVTADPGTGDRAPVRAGDNRSGV